MVTRKFWLVSLGLAALLGGGCVKKEISSQITPPPTTPDKPAGLIIEEVAPGTGAEAVAGKTVSVHYTGKLTTGTTFDSSVGRGPFEFPLGAGKVIPGWEKGIAGMKVGGKRKLTIPPELAYGSQSMGNVIPPNSTLIFEVELLNVK